MKKIRKIKDQDKAVAGVVVAILLIGLFFTALGVIQSFYVPDWMKQKESEHIDDVANQFTQLKFAIDTTCVSEQRNAVITSSITLGSKEMPYFSSSRAYGSLEINPNECKIILNDTIGNKKTYLLGNIKYSSINAYFLNQDIMYENGAIILNQDKGNSLYIQPDFYVEPSGDFSFNLVQIIPKADKTSASGFGSYPIRIKFSESEDVFLYNLNNMTIFSPYVEAWKTFFENTFSKYSIGCSIDDITDQNGDLTGIFIYNLDIDPDPNSILKPDIAIKKNNVLCQIAHGSVE